MTAGSVQEERLVQAIQELAIAASPAGLRGILNRHPFLTSAETDRELTLAIQAGLARNSPATISVHLTVRGFLEHVRQEGVGPALEVVGGAPLYQVDPIAQLMEHPAPSPDHVALCRRALKIVRPGSEPGLWAYLHFLLADRLMIAEDLQTSYARGHPGLYFLPADRLSAGGIPPVVKEAMDAYEIAGDTWEACHELEQAAQARYELARLLIDFVPGEQRGAALARAIELFRSTFPVWTRATHPQEWGNVQALLGLALKNKPGGLDAQALEQAITHYEAALKMPLQSSGHPALERAQRQYHLATLYARRYDRFRVQNVERAVKLLQAALQVYSPSVFPEEWADTQNALGNVLQERLREDPAQNLEQAIGAYSAALDVWTRERHPTRWAATQRNLAEAYRNRILGHARENQDQAIAHFEQALTVYTRAEHPTEWASVQNSLANLYCNRWIGDRGHNIETGIQHYERALEIYTREAYPRQWAQTTNNLANAMCERETGDREENLRQAVALYKQVLEVRTHAEYPREWAATHNNIGTAYAGLDEWEQAAEHFQQALKIRSATALPDKALQSARNLGALHLRLGHWDDAIEAYREAEEASDVLYRQAITEAGKRAEIGRLGNVAHHLAYALARKGLLDEAIVELEHGRARLLAEALMRVTLAPDQASAGDQEDDQNAVRHIQALHSELRAAELDAQGAVDTPRTARAFSEIVRDLASANAELEQVLKTVDSASGGASRPARPSFAEVKKALRPDTPLVYLAATPAGGLALALHESGIEAIWLDELTDEALVARVQAWFGRYFPFAQADTILKKVSARGPWFATLDETTRWLWPVAMEPVVDALCGLGYRRATLIPTGLLAFLPLHAAWHSTDDGSARIYALDRVALAYAPSARALARARQLASEPLEETLLAVNNPDGSLVCADQEVKAVKGTFTKYRELALEEATRETVLEELPNFDIYHFACHGLNNWMSPLESELRMHARHPLTVAHLLELEGRVHAQLAFLSACETGLFGLELPDELVGLVAGFMQAGTARVISSLWSVDDESTAVLAEHFYRAWRKEGRPALEALVAAQQFVRDEGKSTKWTRPYYWAAFTLSGA